MMKTRKFKRLLSAFTAAALSISAVGFSDSIFRFGNDYEYSMTASASEVQCLKQFAAENGKHFFQMDNWSQGQGDQTLTSNIADITKIEALIDIKSFLWGHIQTGKDGNSETIKATKQYTEMTNNIYGVKKYVYEDTNNIALYAQVMLWGEGRLLGVNVYFKDKTEPETFGTFDVPEFDAPTAITGLIADGTEHQLITAPKNSGNAQFEYSTDNTTWSSEIPKATDEGEYTVYYRVKVGTNDTYTPLSGKEGIKVKIEKKSTHIPYTVIDQAPLTLHNYYDDYVEVYECDVNAEKVDIPSEVEGDSKTVPVTRIGENAFNSCKKLTDVKIPETVEEIGASAFWGCTALESLTIPATVTSINKTAFSHCTAFKTIYGYTGSAAEEFAKANGYTFIDLDAVEPASDNKPSAPTNVAISEDGTVTWDNADNAAQYKVFKKYGGTAYYSGWVTDTSYKFKNLPNQDYEIYVAAKNDYGTAWSEHLQVKVENKLGTVNSVTVKDGTISWNAAQGAVAYKVGKVVNGKTYYGSKTTDTSYTFKYVPKSDYKVFVVAFDKEGNKTWGTKVDVKVN